MKNLIISALLVVILNMMPNWQCEGLERCLISVLLVVCGTGVICLIDSMIEEGQVR